MKIGTVITKVHVNLGINLFPQGVAFGIEQLSSGYQSKTWYTISRLQEIHKCDSADKINAFSRSLCIRNPTSPMFRTPIVLKGWRKIAFAKYSYFHQFLRAFLQINFILFSSRRHLFSSFWKLFFVCSKILRFYGKDLLIRSSSSIFYMNLFFYIFIWALGYISLFKY